MNLQDFKKKKNGTGWNAFSCSKVFIRGKLFSLGHLSHVVVGYLLPFIFVLRRAFLSPVNIFWYLISILKLIGQLLPHCKSKLQEIWHLFTIFEPFCQSQICNIKPFISNAQREGLQASYWGMRYNSKNGICRMLTIWRF